MAIHGVKNREQYIPDAREDANAQVSVTAEALGMLKGDFRATLQKNGFGTETPRNSSYTAYGSIDDNLTKYGFGPGNSRWTG